MALPAAAVPPVKSPAAASLGLIHGPQSPLVDTKRTSLRIAASDATVLLMGETGTGKEVFARFIHNGSPRASRPFVPVNCGAIPENLLESELFGYVKGAFTGAMSSRKGRVALAEGGTLFLDEIGELPLSLQVKILRLLQERTYEPIGSSDSLSANFRLVAATNRDLADEVRAGRFRSDLYYRLHVCPIRLPPLRERRGDIHPLFQSFWDRRGEVRPVDSAVIQCLESYAWPGNVRELENLVERISVCSEGDRIRMADLPVGVRAPHLGGLDPDLDPDAGSMLRMDVGSMAAGAPAAASGAGGDPGTVAPRPGGSFAPTPPVLESVEPLESIDLPSLSDMAAQLRARALGIDVTEGGAAASTAAVYERARAFEPGNTPTPIMQFPIDLPTMLRELENRYINAALSQTGSNKKEAAKLLGMGRTTLVEKLRRRSTDQRLPPSSSSTD